MKFSVHIGVSAALAALFYPLFSASSFLIMIGGIFPDVDHYLHFVFVKRRFNPFECNKYYSQGGDEKNYREFDGVLMIFHTVEFLVLMIILSFYSNLFFIFTIGLAVHYLLDAILFIFVIKRFVLNHSILLWLAKQIQKA